MVSSSIFNKSQEFTLVIDPELRSIFEKFDEALKKRKDFELGFNVFSLVSDTYYKENFHSEILFCLLDPEGAHSEGRLFLDKFLDFLNIDKNNYKTDIKVYNEYRILDRRRIDILIRSKENAIIIENKINGATDMENQLIDYYKYCKNEKLGVDAILYLSLDASHMLTVCITESNNNIVHAIIEPFKEILPS